MTTAESGTRAPRMRWTRPGDGAGPTYRTYEPATGRHLADVPAGTAADVDVAVARARTAFDEGPWPTLPAAERAAVLRRAAALIGERAEDLARLEVLDNGATLRKARAVDVPGAHDCLIRSAWEAERFPDRLAGPEGAEMVWDPVGVVGTIVPWNFPLSLGALRIAPALAAGNTCVVKPASFASLAVLELAAALREAGVPPGVLEVVTGPGGEVGGRLAGHPDVDLVVFTGSDGVGQDVAGAAAAAGTAARLNLGGKSPQVVLDDADLAAAVDGVVWGAFLHNGQICMAGSRAVVHRDVHDAFVRLLVARVRTLSLGDPLDPDTDIGPLVSRQHARTVRGYVRTALREGAVLACGGGSPGPGELDEGLDARAYVRPTVLTGVGVDDTVAQEEVFGPVLSVLRVDGEEEAVAVANGTRHRLAAGVWSRDPVRARSVAGRIRAEQVWINEYPMVGTADPGSAPAPGGRDLWWYRLSGEIDRYRQGRWIRTASDGPAPSYDVLWRG
ncbi:aldehyde dehydrogenase family protein [Nocardiopsis sp. RV163]|uniref:aldehyde dehydrogenase family protein n=1 Tax=Nocardiopsis sp. RV163 TaxID=1661388 RepID=UPI00064B9C74|nr:aldehyde dehydrogenase family protein [Nocardiopsis sp. RV163]